MAPQITIRGVSDEVARKLRVMADARGASVNTVSLELLERFVGTSERRERLRRYATWSDDEASAFEANLRAQRVNDSRGWE